MELVQRVLQEKRTVIDVAEEMGLDYENAKLIFRIYKREGRTKQTPTTIKRFANTLRSNPDNLRNKVNPIEYEEIVSTWAGLWERPDVDTDSEQIFKKPKGIN